MATKLGKNMRRRNGRVQAWIFLHHGPGGRPTATFNTVQEARDWQEQTRVQTRRQAFILPTKVTVAEYIETWIARKQWGAESTEQLVSRRLRLHASDTFLGLMPIQDVTAEHIDQWVRDLRTRPGRDGTLMPSTVRLIFGYVNTVFKHAQRNRVIDHNPCADCDTLPVARPHEHTIITPEQFHDGIVANIDPWYRTLTLFLCYAGLRWDETRRLDVADLLPLTGEVRVVSTKRGHRVRLHSLAPWLMDELQALIRERGLVLSDPLFSTRTGGRIINSDFNRKLKRAARLCGVSDSLRPHDLRHNCATWLFDAGFSTVEVADYLGHANDGVTRQVYIGVLSKRQRIMAEALPAPHKAKEA